MWLLHISVERFNVEIQLAQVFGLEATDLEFHGDKTIKRTVNPWDVTISYRVLQPKPGKAGFGRGATEE